MTLDDDDVAMAAEAAAGFKDLVESIYNDKGIFSGSHRKQQHSFIW